MDININDLDWRSILIKKYKNYGLNEEDCMVLMVSDCVLQIERTLITKEVLSPYMANIDKIDESLSNLLSKKYMVIANEGSEFFSSIDDFKKKLFDDTIKDMTLKNSAGGASSTVSASLYTEVEEIAGRTLTALERDRITSWLKSGANEGMVKEALSKSFTKSGHVSFNNADKLILDMQRSETRKSIGASMVNEETKKKEEMRDILSGFDWTYHGE